MQLQPLHQHQRLLVLVGLQVCWPVVRGPICSVPYLPVELCSGPVVPLQDHSDISRIPGTYFIGALPGFETKVLPATPGAYPFSSSATLRWLICPLQLHGGALNA